jgi:hypothetical protein
MTVEESRAVVIMLDVALAVMARLDRAISINAMNRVIAQSGRAMTNGRRRVNVFADRYYASLPSLPFFVRQGAV